MKPIKTGNFLMRSLLACLGALAFAGLLVRGPAPAFAADARQGCHIEEIEDQDGDLQVLMESEWISMHLQPSLQSTIMRFVFRPTGNDILEAAQPKIVASGGGLLQDNFWEQDWRYSEFRRRFYDYQIVKNTPEEVGVTFETKSEGWLQAADSGLISKLLSNIRIRRTVTLKAGTPYFLFDIELSSADKNAKLPLMWVHNSALIDLAHGDQVYRPSARGVRRIGAVGRSTSTDIVSGEDPFVYDFNEGWSAKISGARKEGIVYLMDYNYIQFLYNCGTSTEEWVYDNVLITKEKPWKGRIYILPVMGISKVDFANENFILEVNPKREKGRLDVGYRVTASYEKVARITFNTEIAYDHLSEAKTKKADPVEITGLGVQPVEGHFSIAEPPADPVLFNITAHCEMPDGTVKTKKFQYFHVGEYSLHDNIRRDLVTPVVKLDRSLQQPSIPVPKETAKVDTTAFNVFAVLGNHSNRLALRQAIRGIPARITDEDDVGYTPGWNAQMNGLTDFPYDYDRLFTYRVLVMANSEPQVIRRIGASILTNYLKKGGGLVLTGGDSAFRGDFVDPEHDLNNYLPMQGKPDNVRREALRLGDAVAGHPIFAGIDLSNLPYAYFVHDVQVKPNIPAKVLMKVGDKPFIVELERDGQRTIAVLCAPFGDERDNPGKVPFWKWDQWPKLMQNIVKYAGHG
ncbi:MAG: hypothetical protein NTW19_11745 [Planctomycetota bacterium]|nr:hypothetical protein [Planctomycetota bacterium]